MRNMGVMPRSTVRKLLDHTLDEARNLAPDLAISGMLREGRNAPKELLAAAGGCWRRRGARDRNA